MADTDGLIQKKVRHNVFISVITIYNRPAIHPSYLPATPA